MEDSNLAQQIENHAARLTVIGQGYVGLPLAVEFARAGFLVHGFDADPERVESLNGGLSHTPDVPQSELLDVLRAGRYRATTDSARLGESDIAVICVPTPLRKTKDPDISFIVSASEEVASHFRPNQLVILESTTYPGTTEELLLPMFAARGAKVGVDFFLAFSPERIDPGNTTYKMRDIPKIVAGVTPALDLITRLRRKGARIAYADPHVPSLRLEDGVLQATELTDEVIADVDCVLIVTDHPEFDYRKIVETASLIFDARNATWGLPAAPGRVVSL